MRWSIPATVTGVAATPPSSVAATPPSQKVPAAPRRPEAPEAASPRAGTSRPPSGDGAPPPRTATELLARSYAEQAARDLAGARAAARLATETAPDFGFAWARLAELEFSFGRLREAAAAVDRALALTPENAEALALRGFLAAAASRTTEARGWFDRALAVDGSLGNAWLGRGLTRIRRGDLAGGRADLVTAAAVEPQRSFLRSQLAKAFAAERFLVTPADPARAHHELDLARRLDPLDPVPWLYGGLLARDENRPRDAIRGLETAEDLNDGRALFRAPRLLDQDRAVARANQALAYQDAGLDDVARQAAGRALTADYANPSAHQFLADSYAFSDGVNLRYETPRVSEYLVANLLAPPGGGLLSAALSQQDYARLFERDGVGLFSSTEYLSRGAWFQGGGVDAVFGGGAALVEGYYQSDPGFVANNDVEVTAGGAQFKQQLGLRDTFYAQVFLSETETGDRRLYTDPYSLDSDLRVSETLDPILLAGWHRAWTPEHHTLLLAGWLRGEQDITGLTSVVPLDLPWPGWSPEPVVMDGSYSARTEVATFELQHAWQTERNALVAGGRFQTGDFTASYDQAGFSGVLGVPFGSPGSAAPGFERGQLYAYDTFEALPGLWLTAGLSYDDLEHPVNFRAAPLSDGTDRVSQLSPKAGFLWAVRPRTFLRGAYTRSLGGVGYDQSFRLEPTQVAGFNQALRSVAPESAYGAGAGAEFETFHLGFETRLATNTWLSLGVERLASDEDRTLGGYEYDEGAFPPRFVSRQFAGSLDYEELAFSAALHQLVGENLSFAARYRLTDSDADGGGAAAAYDGSATLHELVLAASFFHRSGVFAGLDARWWHQSGEGALAAPDDEDFWQFKLALGYRLPRRRAEIAVGVLNLTDQDYRLSPVSYFAAPERERTLFLRLRWRF